ncbi:unnamed protein product [Vitrella brassicaformis CCMP3155]|uniref:Uncharacterized protein n=1 Tax=Vitrella brassicaformis (strain CCMP3155) TaxID=1169540 RepID=A0A0G4EJ98_VITBC|nr:unnamed protein product [Vitrella brassicaformis CCMP3155]|eukprot:CEL95990.1 unnamed protein product [Vitrella brassicaformis CCMP3155]
MPVTQMLRLRAGEATGVPGLAILLPVDDRKTAKQYIQELNQALRVTVKHLTRNGEIVDETEIITSTSKDSDVFALVAEPWPTPVSSPGAPTLPSTTDNMAIQALGTMLAVSRSMKHKKEVTDSAQERRMVFACIRLHI